jgi:hemerythrin-like domain-containing protein
MEAVEILRREHDLIRQFLDHLSVAQIKMEQGQSPPVAFFRKAVEFARTFADKYHHFKEEYLLFTRLAMKKDGKIDAQLETLKYLHERGRSLIQAIDNTLEGYRRGGEVPRIEILENIAAYNALLRQHIRQEDRIFLLMAVSALSPQEDRELLEEFHREEEKMGGGFFERSRRLLQEMDELWDSPSIPA